jgi:hypothetical protein
VDHRAHLRLRRHGVSDRTLGWTFVRRNPNRSSGFSALLTRRRPAQGCFRLVKGGLAVSSVSGALRDRISPECQAERCFDFPASADHDGKQGSRVARLPPGFGSRTQCSLKRPAITRINPTSAFADPVCPGLFFPKQTRNGEAGITSTNAHSS